MIRYIVYPDTEQEGYAIRETVGMFDVTEITGHSAQGEGDKWYYDIYYSNGDCKRIFNPEQVFYEKDKEENLTNNSLNLI